MSVMITVWISMYHMACENKREVVSKLKTEQAGLNAVMHFEGGR